LEDQDDEDPTLMSPE